MQYIYSLSPAKLKPKLNLMPKEGAKARDGRLRTRALPSYQQA